MAITNSCAAGREMPRTSKQPILYPIHDNSPGDIPKDRPWNIWNPSYTILPMSKIRYFGLSIALFVLNIRVQTKVSNQTTTISVSVIVTSNQRCVPPKWCLKTRNKIRIDTRTVTRAIKPNRVYKPIFQKEEKRGLFQQSTLSWLLAADCWLLTTDYWLLTTDD